MVARVAVAKVVEKVGEARAEARAVEGWVEVG